MCVMLRHKPILVAVVSDSEQFNEKCVRWENGIKYHDALVGARVIFCSFTANISSPPLLLLL